MGILDALFGPEKRKCYGCGELLPLERFPLKYDKKKPGARKYLCRTCDNRRGAPRRRERRKLRHRERGR
jgi:hypothetical protein